MFLTRFPLNPNRRGAHKLISSPHAMHAAVVSGFADPEPTGEGRVLWRLDMDGPKAFLYIVSPLVPDLTHLVEQAGWPSTHGWETKAYGPLLERLSEGQQWAFRLTANPVHSVRTSREDGRGKPVGHVTATQQEAWLTGRAERAGFSLGESSAPTVVAARRQTLSFRRQTAEVTLKVVGYDGVLTITDKTAFVSTLTNGLGRAKGYGCGLLTIAPVH